MNVPYDIESSVSDLQEKAATYAFEHGVVQDLNSLQYLNTEQYENHRKKKRRMMTPEQRIIHREKNRHSNMTEEQIERHRARQRVGNMSPERYAKYCQKQQRRKLGNLRRKMVENGITAMDVNSYPVPMSQMPSLPPISSMPHPMGFHHPMYPHPMMMYPWIPIPMMNPFHGMNQSFMEDHERVGTTIPPSSNTTTLSESSTNEEPYRGFLSEEIDHLSRQRSHT